jgi:hypothetical protein
MMIWLFSLWFKVASIRKVRQKIILKKNVNNQCILNNGKKQAHAEFT